MGPPGGVSYMFLHGNDPSDSINQALCVGLKEAGKGKGGTSKTALDVAENLWDEPLERFPVHSSTSPAVVSPVLFLCQSWPPHPLQKHRWGMREGEKKPFGMCLSNVEVGANQTKSLIHKAGPMLNKGL